MIRPSMANKLLRPVPERLQDFVEEYCNGGCIWVNPPQDCLYAWEGVTTMVIYRDGQFQVELVIINPDTAIPSHRHDDVESMHGGILSATRARAASGSRGRGCPSRGA